MSENNTPHSATTPNSGTPALPPRIGADSAPQDPTVQMPTTPVDGGGVAGGPPQPPTGFGGPTEPPDAPRNNTPYIIAGIVALAAIVIVVAILLTRGGDDTVETDDTIALTAETTTSDVSTTVPETTTTVLDTTTVATTTTVAETTTTVADTTTTTVPPTTAAPTTVAETTTTVTVPIPVVTVPPAPSATLWDIIVNSPDLSEFKAAIETAGLIDLLDGPEPVTVFVPSNDAIALFEAGVGNDGLLSDPDFLRHHIVDGLLRSSEVLAATTLDTKASDTITVDSGAATVDNAKLVVIDIEGVGGVLHVVDRVLVVQS